MPIKLNYNQQHNFLSLIIEDVLSIDDIEQATLELFDSNEYSHDVNALWDIRELSFDYIDIAFVRQIVAMQKKYRGKRGKPKVAILSNYVLAAPIIKLYVIISKGLEQKTRVFKTVEEAELWLSIR